MARVVFVVQGADFDACLEQARLYLENTGIQDYSVLPTLPRPEPSPVITESPIEALRERLEDLKDNLELEQLRTTELTNLLNAEH